MEDNGWSWISGLELSFDSAMALIQQKADFCIPMGLVTEKIQFSHVQIKPVMGLLTNTYPYAL